MVRTPITILLLLAILVPFVSATGISGPLKPTFVFEPGLEINMTYLIINSAGFGQNLSVGLESDPNYCCADTVPTTREILKNYSKLSWTSQYFDGGSGKPLNIYIKLPNKIDAPGQHVILLRAVELGLGGPGVGAVAAVRTPFFIFVRYPGRHIESRLKVPDVEVGKEQTFYVTVSNKGTSDINRLYARVDIYDVKNRTVATVFSDPVQMHIDDVLDLEPKWNTTGLSEGLYRAKAEVNYDGLTQETDSVNFRIGTLDLKIMNYTREMVSNAINPFEIKVESSWNDVIKNVYGNINVLKDGKLVANFQTSAVDISPWGSATLSGFFENTLDPGNYSMQISVLFSDKTKTIEDSLIVREKGLLISNTTIAFIIFTALLLLNLLLWLIFLWKKKKSKGNPGMGQGISAISNEGVLR